jgi:hypothetical protein
LVTSHNDCFVDVFRETTARKVVNRSSKTLEDWTYGLYATETLNELVCDVTNFERWEY